MTTDTEQKPLIEWRVCWSSSTNITFNGESDWEAWWGDDDLTEAEVETELYRGHGEISEGLQAALEYSGFDWWVETREV